MSGTIKTTAVLKVLNDFIDKTINKQWHVAFFKASHRVDPAAVKHRLGLGMIYRADVSVYRQNESLPACLM